MSVLDWLFGRIRAVAVMQEVAITPAEDTAPTEQECFKSPTLLAGWVNQYLLEGMPLSNNYSLLPSEEIRKSIGMTYEQSERYVREITVLRMAGISLFVRENYADEFWLAFSANLYSHLARFLYTGQGSTETIGEVASAVESYVDASSVKDESRMSSIYMTRVYGDSDHYLVLKVTGVGFLSVTWLVDSYAVFRDAYCKVTRGMPYERFSALSKAFDELESGTAPSSIEAADRRSLTS